MTGNGTKESPYIVSTWGELTEAAKIGSAYIAFPDVPGTINIEEEFGHEEPPTLSVASDTRIDGRGWKIHGLWARNHSQILFDIGTNVPMSIKNLNFSSFYCSGGSFISDQQNRGQNIVLENCVFSGVCETDFISIRPYWYYNRETSLNLKNCAVTLQLSSSDETSMIAVNSGANGFLNMSNCIVKVTASSGVNLVKTAEYIEDTGSVWNCLFNVKTPKLRIYHGISPKFDLSGCIFAGESQSGIAGIERGAGVSTSMNVFDRDAFPGTAESSKFIGVSGSDIKNPAVLSGLGIPIWTE